MTATHRPRRRLHAALTAALAFAISACSGDKYPNTIFERHTEFNREVLSIFNTMFFWSALVFVLVEVALLWVLWRYRRREGQPEPKHVHGHTTLEIVWTLIPAVILIFLAVPTVRAIFRTQAKAVPNALQVQVIGHQWWWEFRYPQYGVITANELYLPIGRTVNFELKTADVIHSFWIPRLGGKRDLVSNHTNYLWFTPDSADETAWNGSCNEYCGASHANMRFRAFTVTPAQFEEWTAHQKTPAAFGAVAPATPGQPATQPATTQSATTQTATTQTATTQSTTPVTAASFTGWPADRMPAYTEPTKPIPAGISFNAQPGDPARGQQIYSRSACIGCHMISGNPMSMGQIGPNLTHVGSRLTIGAGLYPNDDQHLALWIKNTRAMKPGSIMPTLGKGEYDPILATTVTSGLTDQEIADIVAYLRALK
ncbi:MAG: cytochrome c oxidase subunit II [Gemmatimonadaceae bacterium]|nr:cytochrome c oxidase subunit II [Gemmatimonadaceae bacterium]NUQ92320.1 cytochrome c oxidase subunit II [Gemmatimonadaceae bacterium]